MRLGRVQPPVIPIIGRWTADTPGTISLGQGIVGYGPPPGVLEAVRGFGSATGDHAYGPVEGLPELVAAIRRKLSAENGIEVEAGSRVVATAGGNLAFMNAVLAITDPGDEVILPAPFYFNHEMAVVMAGAVAVPVPSRADFQPDLGAIADAITPRTRAVVTVSPNNPTGAVYPEDTLRAVNRLCADRSVFHIHDEAYEYFVYEAAAHFSPGSIGGAGAHTISLFSLSKAYGMASWRLGYMVIPETLWDAVNKIQDTMLICPPAVSQRAALAALQVGRAWAGRHHATLSAVRRRLIDALDDEDVPCETMASAGALYVFVRVRSSLNSMAVTERLIREHRVAVVPGSAFGASDGCYLRVSFGALEQPAAAEGIARLVSGLRAVAKS